MQPRNTQPRHLDNVDAPPSPGSSGRCSCRITEAKQGRLVRVIMLMLSDGGARPPEAAPSPPTPPLGPVVLRQSRQESGGELGQLKKARRGGAKAGALHPARGRLRLAPPLTALWLLRGRSMPFASGVGCSLASSPAGHRPSASPRAVHSRARRRRRASPRRHACLLTREPIEGVRWRRAPAQTEQRPRAQRSLLRPSVACARCCLRCYPRRSPLSFPGTSPESNVAMRARCAPRRVHGADSHPCPHTEQRPLLRPSFARHRGPAARRAGRAGSAKSSMHMYVHVEV